MTTTSLLSLLMGDTGVGPPDSRYLVGDKLSLRNVPGSLASFNDSDNERYYGNCSLPIDIKQTTARQEQQEPPPYSYSPDAYDTEIYGGSGTTRIELDEPPLDAHSPETSPVATPTIGNTRRSTHPPNWPCAPHRTGVISPINLAGSPLTSLSISALEREYDRDTWRLFHRIQLARSLQQQQPGKQQQEEQLQATSRLQHNQRMVSSERLAAEEWEEDEPHHSARMTTDEDDEEIMFAMD